MEKWRRHYTYFSTEFGKISFSFERSYHVYIGGCCSKIWPCCNSSLLGQPMLYLYYLGRQFHKVKFFTYYVGMCILEFQNCLCLMYFWVYLVLRCTWAYMTYLGSGHTKPDYSWNSYLRFTPEINMHAKLFLYVPRCNEFLMH